MFVFGGIENKQKKYSSSIERLNLSFQNYNNPWEKIILQRSQIIPARQGAGMTQLSADEILIVGGFNGKFLSDNTIIKLDRNYSV